MDRERKKKTRPLVLLLSASAFFLVLALLFFKEAAFTGKVQISTDTLSTTLPWSLASPDPAKVRNPGVSDQSVLFYPWFYHTQKNLLQGEIPLWTPHILGGVPYLGNLSTAIFFPINLLLFFLSLNLFLLIQCILKLLCAGIFTYLFLKALGFRPLICLFGGTVYGLSGFIILWIISNLSSVAILAPALFWALELFLKQRTLPRWALISLLLALQFLGAHPETSLCLCVAWMTYAVFRIKETHAPWSCLLHLGLCGFFSLGLVLFQLWPFVEYMNLSLGRHYRSLQEAYLPLPSLMDILWCGAFVLSLYLTYRVFRFSGLLAGVFCLLGIKALLCAGMQPHFLTQLFPDLYGGFAEGMQKPGGVAYPEMNGGYCGILPLLLAMIAMFAPSPKSLVRILSCLFLIFFGAFHQIPFLQHLLRHVPFFDLCQPGRFFCVTVFCLSILSVFGLKIVLEKGFPKKLLGCLVLFSLASQIWGFDLIRTHSFDSRTEKQGIRLLSPFPGETISAEDPLLIKGETKHEASKVKFYLDGLFLGETSGRTFRFPPSQDKNRAGILKLIKEGRHHLQIRIGEHEAVFPIHVSHPKKITIASLGLLFLSLLALVFLGIKGVSQNLRCSAAILVVVFDLWIFGGSYNSPSEPATLFPDTRVTDFLSSREGVFRIFPENVIMHPNTNYIYGYHTVRGYDCLEIKAYNALLNLMKKDPWADLTRFNSETFNYESPVLDLLGVKYILSTDDLDHIPGLKRVFDHRMKIYENLEAKERVFVVGNWINLNRLPKGLDEALSHLAPVLKKNGLDGASMDECLEFLFNNYAFTNQDLHIKGGGSGQAIIEEFKNESVKIRADMEGQGVLIFTDNFFPGWRARVNGQEREVISSLTFKALALDSGEHEVEFYYHPSSFFNGIKISSICAGILLCLILYSVIRRRRTP